MTSHAERGMRLAELILTEAVRAGLGPGSRLPTERKLSVDLGVTRSSIRHALDLLQARGRISREVGRGTFLLDGPQGLPPDPSVAATRVGDQDRPAAAATADFAPADVMAVRRLLEPPAMSLVVAWATTADLEQMDRCLAGGDGAASYEEFEVWDLALHRTIMAASHSPLLVALYASVEAARHGQVWGDLKRRSASPEHREQYQADHRAIVSALHARDSARAVEAMRVHVARVADHLNATDPAAAVTWH
ncbi:MAG: FCD domain-containing protein [Kitasatospora sp.]|jgi:DNA-binding FadR family transcriptional regulator|nr:FCD domain-containing protein [Kitasatospora sp.]